MKTLPIWILGTLGAAFFQLACQDPSECDVKSEKPLEVEIGLDVDLTNQALAPRVTSLKPSLRAFKQKNEREDTGTTLQLLDKNGLVLHEQSIRDPIANYTEAFSEIIRQRKKDQILFIQNYLLTQRYSVSIPNKNDTTTIRIIKKQTEFSLLSSKDQGLIWDFPINKIPNAVSTVEPDFDSDLEKIHFTGNPQNRLNILILGDGYLEGQLPLFRKQSQELTTYLLSKSPFREYSNHINVWRVVAASNEEGASCDDGTSTQRDTLYGSIFPVGCLNAVFGTTFSNRAIVQRNYSRIRAAQSLVRHRGEEVETHVYVLTNSKKAGGASIFWASQTSSADISTFPHELGHSIGNLGDEYEMKNDFCLFFNVFKPNISTQKTAREDIKWAHWINQDTPIPTNNESVPRNTVGLFQGASNCPNFLYRPARYCKMRNENDDFCSVCKEQMVLRIYDYARPIDSEVTATQKSNREYEFTAKVLRSQLGTRWLIDGKAIQTSLSYEPLLTELSPGKHQVTLQVQDLTPFVRIEPCQLYDSKSLEVSVN